MSPATGFLDHNMPKEEQKLRNDESVTSTFDKYPYPFFYRSAISYREDTNHELPGKFCYGAACSVCMKISMKLTGDTSSTYLLAG